jgi:hypothetical protein
MGSWAEDMSLTRGPEGGKAHDRAASCHWPARHLPPRDARVRSRPRFVALSAVFSGVKEVRAAIAEAARERRRGAPTVLFFIDEIHRFHKGQ